MLKLFALSWRNVWRQRGRSLLTAGAVGMAVFFALIYQGLIGAVENGMYATLVRAVGHVQVRVAGYRDKRELRDLLIPEAEGVRAKLQQTQPQAEAVVTLEVPALLSGQSRSRGVLLVGQEQPSGFAEDFRAQFLKEGRMPAGTDTQGIALGTSLARALQVKLGDAVYAYAPGTEGSGAAVYAVVALLQFPDPAAEGRAAYLSLAAAQALAAPGGATRLELHLPIVRYADDAQITALRPTLSAALGPKLSVETWREANPSLAQVLELLQPLVLAIIVIFFVLAGLMVVNTVYLGLLERTREFGVIAALGAGPAMVTRMVLLESLLLCLTGALAGGLLGVGLVARLSGGFTYPGLGQIGGSFGIPEILYPSLNAWAVLGTLAFAVLTGLLAAWWPARVAARMEPVEAMRFNA
jgi:ABC-type lipoprotein release transport system permease subunit